MPLNHIRSFLYAGQKCLYKNAFRLTRSMIKNISDITKESEDMSSKLLLTLLDTYDEEIYNKYDIKEKIKKIITEEQQPRETINRYYDYLDRIKNKIKVFYEEEKINLGMSSTGNSYVYTSFTKKEYLEEIKKDKQQKR